MNYLGETVNRLIVCFVNFIGQIPVGEKVPSENVGTQIYLKDSQFSCTKSRRSKIFRGGGDNYIRHLAPWRETGFKHLSTIQNNIFDLFQQSNNILTHFSTLFVVISFVGLITLFFIVPTANHIASVWKSARADRENVSTHTASPQQLLYRFCYICSIIHHYVYKCQRVNIRCVWEIASDFLSHTFSFWCSLFHSFKYTLGALSFVGYIPTRRIRSKLFKPDSCRITL